MGLFGLSLGFGHQKQTQHEQQSVDANTGNQLGDIQRAFQWAGQAGPSPLLNQAGFYGTAAQQAGNLGFGALSGNQAALSSLLNPYTQNVIDANNANWQHTNAQTANQIADLATRGGAFGGSRYGVALGTALANNNGAQQTQTANLLSQGYNNAIGQATNLAGLGFQGAGLNSNLGFGGVGSPSQWLAQMLKQGFIMPTGTQSSGAGSNTGFNLNATAGR